MRKGILILSLFSGLYSSAQSLQEFISKALEVNYQIQIYKNDVRILRNLNTAGNAGQLPTVEGTASYSNSLNNTQQVLSTGDIREGTNALNTNLNAQVLANWTIFSGFKLSSTRTQLRYLEEIGVLNSQYFIEQTVADITSTYYQLIKEKASLKMFQNTLEVSGFRKQLELKRKETGSGTGLSYLQALVDYQTDSMRVLDQNTLIQTIEIELNTLINSNLERGIILQDSNFNIQILPSKADLLEASKSRNVQLQQQKLQELIAETNERIEKSNRYPTINVFAGYAYTRTTSAVGFIESSSNLGPVIGANIRFNLYNGGNTNRAIANSRIETENTDIELKQIEQSVEAAILTQYVQYQSTKARLDLAKLTAETAASMLKIAQEQFKEGVINGLDYRLTQFSVLEAGYSVIQLEFALKVIEINIRRLTGSVLEGYL